MAPVISHILPHVDLAVDTAIQRAATVQAQIALQATRDKDVLQQDALVCVARARAAAIARAAVLAQVPATISTMPAATLWVRIRTKIINGWTRAKAAVRTLFANENG